MRKGIYRLPRVTASAAAVCALLASAPDVRAARAETPREVETPSPAPPNGTLAELPPPKAPVKTGKYCLDQPEAKILLSHTLGFQINPLGVENQLALSLCMPFTRTPGVLFDFTNVEVGLVNYLSPIYDHQGAFISITPLSFLKLRVEVAGLGIWPIPLDGSGYNGFTGYDDDFSEDVRRQREGGSTTGTVVELSATLQGKVPLPGGKSVLFTDTFIGGLWTVGDAPFYYNSRRDVLLSRSDWVLKNTGALLVEIPLSDNISVRVGAMDDLNYVPRSGYLTNIVAGITTLLVKRAGPVLRNLQPFVRVGGFTSHASSTKFREGEVNVLGGINTFYDLGSIATGDDERPSR